MRPAFLLHPKPEGYVEGTYATPEVMREWVLSMPEDLQLEFFDEVAKRVDLGVTCFQMDHEGRLEYAERHLHEMSAKIMAMRQKYDPAYQGETMTEPDQTQDTPDTVETHEQVVEGADGSVTHTLDTTESVDTGSDDE